MLHIHNRSIKTRNILVLILGLAVTVLLGTYLLSRGHAATPFLSAEPENGTLGSGAVSITDTTASGGKYIKFGTATPPPVPPSGSPVPTGVPGTWTIKFDDEFDGTALDLNKWSNCWFSPSCGSQNNVSTNPANVTVSGGNMILTLASSSSGASVTTNPNGGAKAGYQFQYGVAEARIYFPGNGSNCYNWPAWWTDGQSWPANGENDIAEVLGGDMTVNYHSSSGSHNQGAVPGYWCGGFHTYTLHRQAGKSDVYYDGVKVKSYTTDDGGAPHYLLVNIGEGGSPHTYGTASQVKVDYVRAWQ